MAITTHVIQGPPNNFFFGKCFKKELLNIFSNFFLYFRLILENNFIQMAASAGHAVAYTIGPIFKHIIDCVQLQYSWLHEYCPLKRQLSLACQRNTYLCQHPKNNSPMVSNRSSRWPNENSSAADNAILKNRAQNIECSFGCVACSVVLL